MAWAYWLDLLERVVGAFDVGDMTAGRRAVPDRRGHGSPLEAAEA
jgi:hypothetical protein